MAILIVNYTYANIGFKGQTNAGGKALNFFSTIILQSKRIGWVDITRNKVKVRAGAKFVGILIRIIMQKLCLTRKERDSFADAN